MSCRTVRNRVRGEKRGSSALLTYITCIAAVKYSLTRAHAFSLEALFMRFSRPYFPPPPTDSSPARGRARAPRDATGAGSGGEGSVTTAIAICG